MNRSESDMLIVGRMKIGQYPAADALRLSPLGTGTTRTSFQSVGKIPVVSDRLKRLARLGAILKAVDLSILGEISSAPDDLVKSKLMSMSATVRGTKEISWETCRIKMVARSGNCN